MDALALEAPIRFTNVKGHLDTLEVKELIVEAATYSAKLLVFVRFTRVDSHAKSVDSVTFWFAQPSELQELLWQKLIQIKFQSCNFLQQ